jgi:hypothetical protein
VRQHRPPVRRVELPYLAGSPTSFGFTPLLVAKKTLCLLVAKRTLCRRGPLIHLVRFTYLPGPGGQNKGHCSQLGPVMTLVGPTCPQLNIKHNIPSAEASLLKATHHQFGAAEADVVSG